MQPTEYKAAQQRVALAQMREGAGMSEYTRWWLAHPWHVSGTLESGKVPADCDCGCQDTLKLTHMQSALYTPTREIMTVEVSGYPAGHFYLTDGNGHRDLVFTWRDAIRGIQHVAFPMANTWPTETEVWQVIHKYCSTPWAAANP